MTAKRHLTALRVEYVDFLGGDHLAALMLAQIIYWFRPAKNGDSKLRKFATDENGKAEWWLAKSSRDWFNELRLSRRQAERGIKTLCEKGLIETWVTNWNGAPTVHIRCLFFAGKSLSDANLASFHLYITRNRFVQNVQSITETTTETTNKLLSPVSDTAKDAEVLKPEKVEESEDSLKSISIPKKRRLLPTRSESVEEIISGVKTKRVEVAATRIAEASAGKLTQDSLQAALDQAMKEYHPNLPRLVVTAKPFGVLRKRLLAATVRNLVDFVNFAIREWQTLAGQNRTAFLRDPSKAQKGTPLSSSPTFAEFAYRLPYFIAAYSQNLSTGATTKSKPVVDARIEQLEARLQTAERENQNNKEIIRRIRRSPTGRTTEPEPELQNISPPRRVLGRVKPKQEKPNSIKEFSDLLDDWTPPAWDR